MGLTQFFNGIFTIIGTLIFMLILSPPIALIVVVLTPASLFVAAFIANFSNSLLAQHGSYTAPFTMLLILAVCALGLNVSVRKP
jgi:ATP-binding cassette subfamily B protein